MATPRARGGISLTTSPPINKSPLVCCSSPQMMRRNVVLPQPEGPSNTMNSPSGTASEMPLTAGTSPNFLTISFVNTADIEPPRIQWSARAPPFPSRASPLFAPSIDFVRPDSSGPRANARPGCLSSGLAGRLLHDAFALLRGPFDGVFGARLARRVLRHHVVDDEGIVDLVHRRRRRSRIARYGRPLVRVLQNFELVLRG